MLACAKGEQVGIDAEPGVTIDATHPIDASHPIDAWSPFDGAPRPDAALPIDAAPVIDAPSPPDAGPADAPPCQLVPQSGCAAGEACDLDSVDWATGATECRAVTAAGTETSTCASVTQCAAGYVCIGDGTTSSCMEFCLTDADCTAPGGICVITLNDGSGGDIPGVTLCSQNCTPVCAGSCTGCPTGFGCSIYQESGSGGDLFTMCGPAGTGGDLDLCTTDADCLPGFGCINTGLVTQCLKWCTPPGGSGCTGGAECLGMSEPAVIGSTEYGVCY